LEFRVRAWKKARLLEGHCLALSVRKTVSRKESVNCSGRDNEACITRSRPLHDAGLLTSPSTRYVIYRFLSGNGLSPSSGGTGVASGLPHPQLICTQLRISLRHQASRCGTIDPLAYPDARRCEPRRSRAVLGVNLLADALRGSYRSSPSWH
jgi:hypothetical protein